MKDTIERHDIFWQFKKLREIGDRGEGARRGFLSCKGKVEDLKRYFAGLKLVKEQYHGK